MITEQNCTMLCDFYQLTMGNGYYNTRHADRIAYFDVFFRKVPDGGGYAICAGLEQVINYIQGLHFTDDDIQYLRGKKIFSEGFLKYLRDFKFTGDIWAVPEGTPVFPSEPLLTVRAPAIQAQLIETMLLLLINHQSLIATKANRIVRAAQGRAISEFGSRRAQGASGAVLGARAAYIGGCAGTACVIADELYGVPATGTMAHSWVQMFDSELEAFESYCRTYPDTSTLLVDTYNIEEAVKTAVEVAGPELGGVRIDSGDLAAMAQRVRNQLDALGATNTTITVTNDLDEYALAALQTAPVDSYGVGTMLVTGSGAPTCAMVYKLTEREGADGTMVPVMKKSKDKATVPGRKLAFRSYEYALAEAEHVISGSEEKLAGFTPEPTWKNLLVDFVDHGHIDAQWQGHDAIMAAHDYHAKALSELPITAQSLMKGEPVIPTETQVL